MLDKLRLGAPLTRDTCSLNEYKLRICELKINFYYDILYSIMAVCFNCEKGSVRGRSHSHHRGVAGGRWKKRAPKTIRVFKPNLQNVTVSVSENQVSIKLCTKCIKRIKKDTIDGKKPFLNLVSLQEKSPQIEQAIAKA